MNKVITKENFCPSVGEAQGKQFGVFTEQAGYISTEKKIESFIYSGELLKAAREGSFDSDEFEPFDDPSLDVRDYELSEIGMLMNRFPQSQTLKGENEGETGVFVSPSTESGGVSPDDVA